MRVAAYEPGDAAAWDELAAVAPMATFLHTRRFLDSHGDRLEDASLMLRDGEGNLAGVLPAAVGPGDEGMVATHPGATYGGIVHDGRLTGPAMLEAFEAVRDHYGERGFERLVYMPVPFIYQRRPSGDDLYALFRLGARRTRCDLSCAIDMADGPQLSSRRRRGLSKARRAGVEVVEGPELVRDLWPVVEANLAERHGVRPLHDANEMRTLVELFPDEIAVVAARLAGDPVAGVVLFDSDRTSHAQYIASIGAGHETAALDAVFDHCLSRSADRGTRFFDFGTSNRDAGRVLNDGLYTFKAEFGGGGVAYEHYELALRGSSA